MGVDSSPETSTLSPNDRPRRSTSRLESEQTSYGLGARLAELVTLFAAVIGALALGLGISDYLSEHPYVLGYLIAYAGFRIADTLLRVDPAPADDGRRIQSELPILILFAAAPFERTYLYGSEPPESMAAFGLLMELAGLWLVIGARVQLRFGAGGGRELVHTGFYRLIRHPILAGTGLVMLAWTFEYSAPIVALITLGSLLLVAQRRIRVEESEMLARFGPEYASYVQDTDRLIPDVW